MLGKFFVEGRYSQGMAELLDLEDVEGTDTYNQSLSLMAGFQFWSGSRPQQSALPLRMILEHARPCPFELRISGMARSLQCPQGRGGLPRRAQGEEPGEAKGRVGRSTHSSSSSS